MSKYFGTEVVNQYCNEAYPGAFDNGTVEGYEARVAAVQQRFRGYETSAERVFVVNGRRLYHLTWALLKCHRKAHDSNKQGTRGLESLSLRPISLPRYGCQTVQTALYI